MKNDILNLIIEYLARNYLNGTRIRQSKFRGYDVRTFQF